VQLCEARLPPVVAVATGVRENPVCLAGDIQRATVFAQQEKCLPHFAVRFVLHIQWNVPCEIGGFSSFRQVALLRDAAFFINDHPRVARLVEEFGGNSVHIQARLLRYCIPKVALCCIAPRVLANVCANCALPDFFANVALDHPEQGIAFRVVQPD